MPRGKPLLTDDVWEKIEPFFPSEKPGPKGGRPRASNRLCFEGILWILKTGAPWRFLPEEYPSPSTVWRRLARWTEEEIWEDIWRAFLLELTEEEETSLGRDVHRRELRPRKKGGPDVGKTKRGKGTKLMVLASQEGLPLAVAVHSASPHESTLVEEALEHCVAPPESLTRLIADRAYDSDKLRDALALLGIDLICPHRSNRKRPPRQDGRKLRRYRKRWKIERLFAWLQEWRRALVRYEWYPDLYRGFVCVAFVMMLAKRL